MVRECAGMLWSRDSARELYYSRCVCPAGTTVLAHTGSVTGRLYLKKKQNWDPKQQEIQVFGLFGQANKRRLYTSEAVFSIFCDLRQSILAGKSKQFLQWRIILVQWISWSPLSWSEQRKRLCLWRKGATTKNSTKNCCSKWRWRSGRRWWATLPPSAPSSSSLLELRSLNRHKHLSLSPNFRFAWDIIAPSPLEKAPSWPSWWVCIEIKIK